MGIRPVETEFFLADKRTAMTKFTDAFRNFTKLPKNKALRGDHVCDVYHRLNCNSDFHESRCGNSLQSCGTGVSFVLISHTELRAD